MLFYDDDISPFLPISVNIILFKNSTHKNQYAHLELTFSVHGEEGVVSLPEARMEIDLSCIYDVCIHIVKTKKYISKYIPICNRE